MYDSLYPHPLFNGPSWKQSLDNQTHQCLDLGLPRLQTLSNKISIFYELPSLRYFALVAQMD